MRKKKYCADCFLTSFLSTEFLSQPHPTAFAAQSMLEQKTEFCHLEYLADRESALRYSRWIQNRMWYRDEAAQR